MPSTNNNGVVATPTFATFKSSPPAVTADEVIEEVRNFIAGATHASKVNGHELAKCAIFLLKTIPATKEAVLEYLCSVFDEAVTDHMHQLELETGGPPGSTAAKFDEAVIQDVHGVLSQFITSNPEAWAPIVSTWSLELLGVLSGKYSERRTDPLGGTLTELLQLWMTCRATRTLLDLTTQCISTLINSNPDACIDALLKTSAKHSPNFDWVVAHIGSCFPNTIITRVLACGLKDFCSHETQMDLSPGMPTEKKVPKLASVVGILGHLANQHSEDIRVALLSLFHDSFSSQPTAQHFATIPFLLQLASMSNMLLRVITTDIVVTLNVDILNQISEQVPRWRSSFLPDLDSLVALIVHLVLRSEDGGTQVVLFLLDTADDEHSADSTVSPKVHGTCALILDCLLLELQRLIYTSYVADVPLLHCLKQNLGVLCANAAPASMTKLQYMLPLLTHICLNGGERMSSSVLIHLLMHSTTQQLTPAKILLSYLEPSQSELLTTTVDHVIDQMANTDGKLVHALVKNLLILIRDEVAGKPANRLMRSKIIPFSHNIVSALSSQLLGPSMVVAEVVAEILTLVPIVENIPMHVMVNLSKAVVKYFFKVLKHVDTDSKVRHVKLCKTVVGHLCQNASSVQQFIIRLLMEGVTNDFTVELFGGKSQLRAGQILHEETTLLHENKKHAVSVTLPVSHSSVFHAGVIGKGLRTRPKKVRTSTADVTINCQSLIELLQVACARSIHAARDNANGGDGAVALALLMVEMLSSDVMFNGLPWPEDDFMKVTVERDLCIKRWFDDCPILWSILKLLAISKPALCYCSVLLRALTAVTISFWGSCQEKISSNCPKQLEVSCKIIDLMAISQLLPPPLSYTSELFPQLTPFEVCVIFYDIWRYMRENIPSPAAFAEVKNTYHRQFQPETIKPFTVRLRHILQNKIDKFGSLYGKFFS